MPIIFGNFWKKPFWGWETFWQNSKGERVSQCDANTSYTITTYYFWFLAIEFKKPYTIQS